MTVLRFTTFIAAVLVALPAFPQAVRFDSIASTTSPSCAPGANCPLLVTPGTTVAFCTGSGLGTANTAGTVVTSIFGPSFTGAFGSIQIAGATYTISTVVSSTILVLTQSAGTQTGVTYSTLSGCLANPVTTYTSSSAGTSCSTNAQLTPATGGACVSTADNQGNFGAWMLAGLYFYYLSQPASAGGKVLGPYPLNIGASSGCPSNATCDANYATLALADAAAGSGTLYCTKAWNNLASHTYTSSIVALETCKIQAAASAAVTLAQCPTAGPYQIADATTNGGASVVLPACSFNVPVEWYGAGKSGSTNDQPFIQAAIYGNMTCGTQCAATNTLQLSAKTYPITSTLYGYNQAAGKEIIGFSIAGQSSQESIISYSGPTNTPALKIVSPGQRLQNFEVLDFGSGWSTGIDYDGISGIGISSQSVWDHVFINCGYQPGDGVQIGPGGGQADQLTITNASQIWGCLFGTGLNNTFNPNSRSIILTNSSLFADYVGVKGGNSNSTSMIGGEIDECAINFQPGLGGTFLVSHVGTENSGRQLFTSTGGAPQFVRFDSDYFASAYDIRPTTTATGGAGASNITLAVTGTPFGAVQFTCGDWVNIAGSGSGTQEIVACSSPTSVTVSPALTNAISGAAVTLAAISTSAPQDQFIVASEGPYSFTNSSFGPYASGSLNPFTVSYSPRASITIESSAWAGVGILTQTIFGNGSALTSNVQMRGNFVDSQSAFGGPFHLYDWAGQSPDISVATFAGANNAITVPAPAPYSGYLWPPIQGVPGLLLTGFLANSLQAGTNYLYYPNGSGFGTVTTSGSGGNTVTSVTGTGFNTGWTGYLAINNIAYPISSCSSTTVCTVTGNPGVQTGVSYYTATQYMISKSTSPGTALSTSYASNGIIQLMCVTGSCVDMKQ